MTQGFDVAADIYDGTKSMINADTANPREQTMRKTLLPLFSATLFSIYTVTAAAQSMPDAATPVLGSDSVDFHIYCQKDGKSTFGIYDRNNTSDYQVARNISYSPLGNGRYALHFLRGFVTANKPDTYFPASDENCEVTQK